MASLSLFAMAHPPRSNPPLRSSSDPPSPCITPSTVTIVVVVSFISRFLSRGSSRRSTRSEQGPHVGDVVLLNLHRAEELVIRGVGSATSRRDADQARRRGPDHTLLETSDPLPVLGEVQLRQGEVAS